MIFDELCSYSERYLKPERRHSLGECKLFTFTEDLCDLSEEGIDYEERRLLSEAFFLPYPHVALEDSLSCVALFDPEEGCNGSEVNRYYLACFLDDAVSRKVGHSPDSKASGYFSVFGGSFDSFLWLKPGTISLPLKVDFFASVRPDLLLNCKVEGREALDFVLRTNCQAFIVNAVRDIAMTNVPSHLIVEETDLTVGLGERPADENRILRSEYRKKYKILTPGNILEEMGHALKLRVKEQGKKVVKLLRPRRLGKHQGRRTQRSQRLNVRAVWNYDPEWTDERKAKRYRIVLDR